MSIDTNDCCLRHRPLHLFAGNMDIVHTNSTLTNRQRGNEATVRPATLDSKTVMS